MEEAQAAEGRRAFIHQLTVDTPGYKWWVSLAVTLGTITMSMGVTLVNIAVPKMMAGLGARIDEIQWVVTAHMIARALVMPLMGWLSDMMGNKRLFLASVFLAVLGSFLSASAWDMGSLIFFRVIQGFGSGLIQPLAMVILYEAFTPAQRGLAMGVYMFGLSFGPAIGPVVGGYFVEEGSWRYIFYITLPPGILCLILSSLMLPSSKTAVERKRVDYLGLSFMSIFLVSLLMALSQGELKEWDSRYIITLFIVSAISFVLFLIMELKARNPVVDLNLFKNLSFASVGAIGFLNQMGFMGIFFLLAVFLQQNLDYTPFQTGVLLLPGAFFMGLSSLIAGKLSDLYNPKFLMTIGFLVFFLFGLVFSKVSIYTTSTLIVIMLMIYNTSFGFVISPISDLSLRVLREEEIRMGSGLLSLLRAVGGTMGVALATVFLNRRAGFHVSLYIQDQNLSSIGTVGKLESLKRFFLERGDLPEAASYKALVVIKRRMMEEVSMAAYHDYFRLLGYLSLLIIIPTLLLRTKRKKYV